MDDKPDYTLGGIIRRILISRGAPKEKYSIKSSEVKMIWWEQNLFQPLPKKQLISILDLQESLKELENYNGLSPDEVFLLTKDEYYKRLRKQYFEDIKKAISLGLIWHPLVSEYFYTHKSLRDNKDILRIINRGWEKSVKRPTKMKDIRFILHLDKIVERRNNGKTWKELRRDLMKRKIIQKMSWQALENKVKKAWRRKWERRGKKPPPIR